MRVMQYVWFLVLMGCCLLGNILRGQETNQKRPAVIGTWSWQHRGDTKTTNCQLSIARKDGKWHCQFKAGKKTYESDEGSFQAGKFSVVFPVKGKEKQYLFQGKVANNKMTGTYQVPSSGDKEIKWSAKRTLSLAEAAGEWQLYFETPDGQSLEPLLTLSVENGAAQVEFSGSGPELDISEVNFEQGVLTVAADIDFQGQAIALEYELEFGQKDLDGFIYFELQATGDQGEIEVEGERVK